MALSMVAHANNTIGKFNVANARSMWGRKLSLSIVKSGNKGDKRKIISNDGRNSRGNLAVGVRPEWKIGPQSPIPTTTHQ